MQHIETSERILGVHTKLLRFQRRIDYSSRAPKETAACLFRKRGSHRRGYSGKKSVLIAPRYIYSKEDLSKLFKEIDSLQPSLRAPTKHLVVSVIFRLIYCCGLRPVEARRLRREDVNLFDGTVNILESKGHKDRIVVLSEDMLELCRNYDLRVEKIYPHRKYFFQSPSVRGDGMYSMEWIIPTFRRFLQTAGISGCGEIRPRLYDLRHTFATHRLYQWVKEGKDINACLAYLSEYMGHSNLESTAYYIHLLPTLYTDLPELRLDSSLEMEADLCD